MKLDENQFQIRITRDKQDCNWKQCNVIIGITLDQSEIEAQVLTDETTNDKVKLVCDKEPTHGFN